MTHTVLTRRAALGGAAAMTAGALAGAPSARAAAPMLGASQPIFNRFTVGSYEVTTILDGAVQIPGPHPIFGQNTTQEAVAALAEENFLPGDKMEIPFTVTLVNTGSELVLFDTGNGGDLGRRPNAGLLLERLAAAGFSADQIDVVVLTHFHPDHIGGMTEGGETTFPNARYVTAAAEFDFWTSDDLLSDEGMAKRHAMVQSKVAGFAEKMSFIEAGGSVLSGIEAVDGTGHTPGHMCYHIESEGERLVLIADLCNHYVVSLQRPDWHVRFDMDKDKAVAARKRVLGMIAADRVPFVGYHMPSPAVGYLETLGEGFRFVPASYQLRV
ncbi:MAG: MBL fold metallo-hydrolase [Pseudomonadota bacterium]